jgi:hypothetical protein
MRCFEEASLHLGFKQTIVDGKSGTLHFERGKRSCHMLAGALSRGGPFRVG